jgi:pimeloyl-ACP methyl ester carboxylesterase
MKYLSLLTLYFACCLAPRAVDAADEVFDSNGVKIRYVTEGQGKPVVLIHGWMADSTMWGRDQDGNTKLDTSGTSGFQLIALDCRGHGKSDKPHDPEKYGPEMAADVVRLLDHLKIEKAHLSGYSMGAFIAGKVAATHPERVLSVVYGGQAPLIAGAKSPESSKSSEVDVFAKAVDEGRDLGAYIIAVTPPGKPKPTPEQARAIANFLYGGKDVKAFAAAGRSFKGLAVTGEQLRKCTAPILFIHGGNESHYVKDRVATARKLLGRGEVKVVEGADHIPTLTKPEFASAVLAFLRSGKPK